MQITRRKDAGTEGNFRRARKELFRNSTEKGSFGTRLNLWSVVYASQTHVVGAKFQSAVVEHLPKASKLQSVLNSRVVEHQPKGSKLQYASRLRKATKVVYYARRRNFGTGVRSEQRARSVDDLLSEYQQPTDQDLHGTLSVYGQLRLKALEGELFKADAESATHANALEGYREDISKLDELIRLNEQINSLLSR
jgi:hypothetical protein